MFQKILMISHKYLNKSFKNNKKCYNLKLVGKELSNRSKEGLCESVACQMANECLAQKAFRKINDCNIDRKGKITELKYNYGQAVSRGCQNAENLKPEIHLA